MAFTDKLTAIANAVRKKTGKTEGLTLEQIPDEISSIQTNGAPVIESLTVSENGTYEPPDGVDGYSPVTVNVESGNAYDSGYEEGYANGYETAKEEVLSDPQTAVDIVASTAISGDITILATNIANHAFSRKTADNVVAPNAEAIGQYGFSDCVSLLSGDFPKVTSLGNYSFNGCNKLTTINVPLIDSAPIAAFYGVRNVKRFDFHRIASITASAFAVCSGIQQLIIRTDKVCSLASTQAFANSAIASKTCLIFVPSSLVDSYKSATNWSTYATLFRAVEDITVDGTIMGELDEDKIAAAMATL